MIVEEKTVKIKKEINEFVKGVHLSLLEEGKIVYLMAKGRSMHPFLKDGDRIKAVPIGKKEIRIGDIIAVNRKEKNGGWFFVHRVVKIKTCNGDKIYFTKGDAYRKAPDEPVTIGLIAGKITQVKRKNINMNLESPIWRFFNNIIAKVSLNYPKMLISLSRYIDLAIEWRLFLFKLKRRLKKGNPLIYNTNELLFICARNNLDEKLKGKAVNLLNEGVDWRRFVECAMRGGVTILVYKTLKTLAVDGNIPQFVFNKLKAGYMFIMPRVALQYKELIAFLELFAKNDIPVVPLKGLLLSKRLYGDIVARDLSADIDLLIEEKNKEKAKILIEKRGYNLKRIPNEGWHGQYVFLKQKEKRIDLHWDIITFYGRNESGISELLNGIKRAENENITYYEFKEEELLLYLSAHFTTSDFFRHLKYICDINESIFKYKDIINWDRLIGKAKSWGLSTSFYIALKLSKEFFNSDVPLKVLRKLRPMFLKCMFINIIANKKAVLYSRSRKRLFEESVLKYIFFGLMEAHSPKEAVSVLFPPKKDITTKSHLKRILKGISKLYNHYF